MCGGNVEANESFDIAKFPRNDANGIIFKISFFGGHLSCFLLKVNAQKTYSEVGRVHFLSLVEKLSFMTILCHFGCFVPNIRVNLDPSFLTFMSHWTIFLSHWTFLVILDNVTKDHVIY